MKAHRNITRLGHGVTRNVVRISLVLVLTEIIKRYIINNKPTVGLSKEKTMARTVKEQEYATKRNEILDIARKLVYTKGYEQMSIQDILPSYI